MSIFSEYTRFQYLFPPRAESAIKLSSLHDFGEEWIAQPKYNGSCAVLFINGDKDYKIYNRHGEPLTLQQPLNYVALNDSDSYMVLCGEYLNKNKIGEGGIPFNHKFIIWDILVWKGKYLIGWTLEERLKLLYDLYGTSRSIVTQNKFTMYNHLLLTAIDSIFLAPSYVKDFTSLYQEIVTTDLYEGLVLKKKEAKLDLGFKEKNNSSWQVKVRKETKSYRF